jgi:hypothetical protein
MYKAYNRLYFKGKPIGRKYIVSSGKNKDSLRKSVERYNRKWNKQEESKYKAKLVEISRSKKKKKKTPRRNIWNLY